MVIPANGWCIAPSALVVHTKSGYLGRPSLAIGDKSMERITWPDQPEPDRATTRHSFIFNIAKDLI